MLKKCIVIMVMFALVAGAAFAQVTFGGQLQEGITLLSGTNVKEADTSSGGASYHEAKFSVLFGDGTAGGRLVWKLNDGDLWGWMQWRPSQYFRIKIGTDGDGEWGFTQIGGWGFTGEAKNSVSAVSDYDGSVLAMNYKPTSTGMPYGGFDGGSGAFHLGVSFFPIDMLQINLLFRSIDSSVELSERLAKLQLSASYKIEEIGTVRFAAVGNGGLQREQELSDTYDADGNKIPIYNKDQNGNPTDIKGYEQYVSKKGSKDGDDIGTLHLHFYSNELVQGFAFEVGGAFNLPHKNEDTYGQIGLAAAFNLTTITDPFNLKLRFGTKFGGKSKGVDNEKVGFGIGVLPSYKLPKMTIFLHAGFGYEKANNDAEAITEWFINPYVWVPMGGMRMWVGLQIIDTHNATQDGQITWKVPFGFNFYF